MTISDLPSERATQIVNERQGTYGHPGDVYSIAAAFWSQVFRIEVTVHQVAECLALVKHAREINGDYPVGFRDNRDDMAGYANVAQMIHEWEGESGLDPGDAEGAQGVADEQLPTPDEPSAPPRDSGGGRGTMSRPPEA